MNQIERSVQAQRNYFNTGGTLPIEYRLNALRGLRASLKSYEPLLLNALNQDLNKPAFEGYATELGVLYGELDLAIRSLWNWARPKRVKTPLIHFPSTSSIYKEPLGVVLIISPWNYPLQLAIAPLIAAIAAGNCCVLKLPYDAEATSRVLAEMLGKTFSREYIAVFEGDVEVCTQLLECRFDHIFFTGGIRVGHIVLKAAEKHLTPVTLELGGKSPCIVDETADLSLAAKRIMWGKLINAGQTCVAPDYLLVDSRIATQMVEELQKAKIGLYGLETLDNPEYGRIINQHHFERLRAYLMDGKVAFGGNVDLDSLKIEPTVLTEVDMESSVMQEEIFGPILPVIPYQTMTEAIELIRKRPKPLALYLFSNNYQRENRVIYELSYGCGCINDTVVQLTNPALPFGGVGESGMGAYHGKAGFDTFSHQKSVLKKSVKLEIPFRYAPYGERLSTLKKMMK